MTAPNKPRGAGGVADSSIPRSQTPAAWLERDYDQADRFKEPEYREVHTPRGIYQVKPNHIGDCYCETGEGEYWLSGNAAMKWRAK